MENVRQRIASNIKSYRKAAGLSVDEVGDVVGKSGKTISAWEVGRGQPNADETVTLCRLFEIEIRDLYGEKPEEDERERRLLKAYRSMTSEGQDALLAIARTLLSLYLRVTSDE